MLGDFFSVGRQTPVLPQGGVMVCDEGDERSGTLFHWCRQKGLNLQGRVRTIVRNVYIN